MFFWTTSRDFGGERKARVGNPRFFLDHFAGLRVKKKTRVGHRLLFRTTSRDFGGEKKARVGHSQLCWTTSGDSGG